MALSRTARAFNQKPTVENFKKLVREKPIEAASWVRNFSYSQNFPQKLTTGIEETRYDSGLSATDKAKKLEKLLTTHIKSVERAIEKAIKADVATPVDLGWSTVELKAEVVQGSLSKNSDGYLTFKTTQGTFRIASPDDTKLSTNDLSTFAGGTVSIRGYVDTPSSGRGKVFVAEEWTPGQHRDLVSGRVEVSGDKVGIRVNSDKFVEVTDRSFKKLLKDWDRVGLSFAGEIKQSGKSWVFSGRQPEVHILTSLGDPPAGKTGQYLGAITPSPSSSSTPTTITGPKVDTLGYKRRFVAGHIVAAPPGADTSLGPARAFEMTKAWKAIDGNVTSTGSSGVEFSPILDGADTL